ncbi:Serpentine Receptor, class J [Caenorhabditis elegans]|nr:Serpentine Receptor, class J [Caenorhabditis elegans]CZR14577.1 Serpentine Receptor, class J [Caenorhabditis elegans]|eukprot:NP_001309652.1 Serpentine Receptor, class J [Caenorhabditis elegans]
MSNRCGFISLSYALLIIHFVYRYMALFHADKLPIFFQPLGIIISIIFLLMHAASWSVICQQCLAGNEEVREIISIDFLENFGANSKSLPMLAAIYYLAGNISAHSILLLRNVSLHYFGIQDNEENHVNAIDKQAQQKQHPSTKTTVSDINYPDVYPNHW